MTGALREATGTDEIGQRKIKLPRAGRNIMEARASRFLPALVDGSHAGKGLVRTTKRVSQEFPAVLNVADFDSVVDVRYHRNASRRNELDMAAGRADTLPRMPHLK